MMKPPVSGQVITMGCAQVQHPCGLGLVVSHAEAPALAASQLCKPNSLGEVQLYRPRHTRVLLNIAKLIRVPA